MGMSRAHTPEATHKSGDVLHGFRIKEVTLLHDIKARAYEAVHEKTGAEVLHLHCNDEENLFSVGFRTPPPDSTGVAHILEHSVLAGSEKYPVKDAFNELGKRTLNTFLNAMTWPDRTVYPVASAVRADYFNLASVYADLVFHPLLREETFLQEGHHQELKDLEDPESPLTISGIVYNEMKGVYASPENVAYREMQQKLFPDTPYGLDSGGAPEVIPELTYEDFCNFHKTYYSASNARFLLYGDVNLEDNLAFLAQILEPFDKVEVHSELPLQPSWDSARNVERLYPVGEEENLDNKTFVTFSWLLNETADVLENLLIEIAISAIYGSAAGPLRKALVDSELGQDVFPSSGFDNDIRQSVAHFGLRGTESARAGQIESLVFETLQEIVREGIDPALIEATFHQIEFYGKEINPPFPVMLMMRANPAWYFGGDPKSGLEFSGLVEEARRRYADNPRLFEDLLQHWLIDNTHRLRMVLRPSNTLSQEQNKAFEEKMAATKAAMSEEDIEAVREKALALKASQEEAPDPEALARLPQLDVADIPREVRLIPSDKRLSLGAEIIEHPVFSNGVAYLGLTFDTRDIEDELAPYMPLLGRATTGLGAAGHSYDQMAVRIAQHTGGFSASPTVGRHLKTGELFEGMHFDGKFLPRNADEFFRLLTELLTESNTQELKRLRDLTMMSASRSKSQLVPRGHMYAYIRAAASLDLPNWRREQWEGTTQIQFLQQQAHGLEDNIGSLASTLASLQKRIFVRNRIRVHVAADPEVLVDLRPRIEAFLQSLPKGDAIVVENEQMPEVPKYTGVVIPAEVNYVGQVLQFPNMLNENAAAFEMFASILSNDFLYQKIRVQGGAYGGFSFYVADTGMLPLLSYRDPNLLDTFKVYEQIEDYLRSDAINDAAVEGSRLGTIGSNTRVLAPRQQLNSARRRLQLGLTDEDRQQFRNGLFDVDAKKIREAVLDSLGEALANAPKAALGSKQKLEEANETLETPLELLSLD